MKHVGDITKLDGTKLEPVWCIVGGSPCQDLSVAGKRKGLAGERSGLFMEQIRIIKEMRSVERTVAWTDELVRLPRFSVWENVFGAYSSNNGYDFLAVLEEFAHIAEPEAVIPRPEERNGKLRWEKAGVIVGDGWSVAWRTHDAQYWGVPQRRRRISVVADFGGQCAGEILFERESLSGNTQPGGETREEAAGAFEKSIAGYDRQLQVLSDQGGSSINVVRDGISPTLRSESHQHEPIVAYTLEPGIAAREGGHYYENVSGTLRANAGDNQMSVCQPVLMTMQAIGQYKECGVSSSCKTRDYKDATDLVCMPTLEPVLANAGDNYMATCQPIPINLMIATRDKALGERTGLGIAKDGDPAFTKGNISPTITGDHEYCVTDYTAVCVEKLIRWIVRRLTPMECERLQGFPDGWTDLGDWTDSKGKKRKASDTPRYKALGNSIALPFWKWMFRNMARYLPEGATMGSLFDGIGGFTLCWEEIHGKGTARWASEIEEFPIAVTKERFKEET